MFLSRYSNRESVRMGLYPGSDYIWFKIIKFSQARNRLSPERAYGALWSNRLSSHKTLILKPYHVSFCVSKKEISKKKSLDVKIWVKKMRQIFLHNTVQKFSPLIEAIIFYVVVFEAWLNPSYPMYVGSKRKLSLYWDLILRSIYI